MTAEQLGLRERKRLATRRSIQVAVLTLIDEKGLDRVTVEDISTRADVSPRTFFNYFPSKEAAAIGDAPGLHDRAAEERFVAGETGSDVLDGVAELLVSAVERSADDAELLHLRRSVLRENPQLFAMRMATMRSFEDEVTAAVVRRLASDDSADVDAPGRVERARLVTFVASAALRHAWLGWSESDGRGPLSDRIRRSFSDLDGLVRGARADLIG